MPEVKTREELERELKAAEDDLDEVEEMRMAILGQTGVHIGARELQKHHSRFDSDQKRLQERIAEIKAELAAL
jgi:DNA repair exonuclease SbcCD ATPase subunit